MSGSSDAVPADPTLVNPYVGPRPFVLGETLYGRDRELAELVDRLHAERIVLLHSPSGAGKSSLIHAGLLPEIGGVFDAWGPTRVNQLPPLDDVNRYVASVNLGFEEGVPEKIRRPAESLARQSLAEYVAGRPRRRRAPRNTLLIFDQFEEILTTEPLAVEAKRAFFDQLGDLLHDPRIWALFALREDYLAPLEGGGEEGEMPYARRVPTQLKNRFRIDLLGLGAARVAMEEPARTAGREFPAVERLVRDLATHKVQQADYSFREESGRFVEPLHLQVVCRRLWEAMPDDDFSIDPEDLERFGDVDGALGDYYNDAVYRAGRGDVAAERAVREWFGERLITNSGIRRQVLMGQELGGGLDASQIATLRDALLVRAEKRAGATWLELAHDRLIEPVRRSNAAWRARNLSAVQLQAALWQKQNRPAALLMWGEALEVAERWAAAPGNVVTAAEEEFLEASREKEAARKQVRRDAMRTRVLVLVALGTVLIAWQWWQVHRQAQRARELVQAATSGLLINTGRVGLGQLAALEIERPEEVRNGVATLHSALAARPDTLILQGHEDFVVQSMFSPDGTRVLTTSWDEDWTARIWDAHSGASLVLEGHEASIGYAVWSPDSARVLTASADQTARIWNAATGASLHTLEGHQDDVLDAAWSSDGARVLTASADQTARIWNAATGESIHRLEGHQGYVYIAAWSPDDARVLTASSDQTARIWDARSGMSLKLLDDHEGFLHHAAWNPDGTRVLTASADHTTRIWDSEGEILQVLEGHTGNVVHAAWSPQGSWVLTASRDDTARIWASYTGEAVQVLEGHQDQVVHAAWSPDGRRVLTASADATARVWDPGTGETLLDLRGHEDSVDHASWSPDGRRLTTASADRTARIWSVDSGEKIHHLEGHRNWVVDVAWSPDGHQMLTASWDGSASIWEVRSGRKIRDLAGHGDKVVAASWSPDGGRLLTASWDRTAIIWNDSGGRLVLGDPATPEAVALPGETSLISQGAGLTSTLQEAPQGHTDYVTHAAWSPEGRRVLTASKDGTARLWDAETGESRQILRSGAEPVVQATWSPDGEWVLTASAGDTAHIWNARSGEILHVLTGHEGSILDAAWSPGGAWVVLASEGGRARIWSAELGEVRHVLEGHEGAVVKVAWSPDGAWVLTASADATARIWNATTGEVRHALRGHQETILDTSWSPDGRRVLTASADNTARIWSARSGESSHHLRGHRADVLAAAWSPDGAWVLTASADKAARMWIAGGAETLQARLRAQTRLCLPAELRRHSLGESAAKASHLLRTCEACVPAFYARLGEADRSELEPYLEAWRVYQECLDDPPDE